MKTKALSNLALILSLLGVLIGGCYPGAGGSGTTNQPMPILSPIPEKCQQTDLKGWANSHKKLWEGRTKICQRDYEIPDIAVVEANFDCEGAFFKELIYPDKVIALYRNGELIRLSGEGVPQQFLDCWSPLPDERECGYTTAPRCWK